MLWEADDASRDHGLAVSQATSWAIAGTTQVHVTAGSPAVVAATSKVGEEDKPEESRADSKPEAMSEQILPVGSEFDDPDVRS